MAKKILQIDGGGLKGVIPAVILDHFEKVMQQPCWKIFDLITGTSTGAILGGVLASGYTDANTILKMYLEQGPKLFTPRVKFPSILGTIFAGSKYNREPFIKLLKQYTGNKNLEDVSRIFMATAFNLCSGRTHFIYSNDKYETHYPLWKVISWSALSAALYFGKIDVPDFVWDDYRPDGSVREDVKGAVFQDGGQGINNCTLNEATVLSIARRWFDEDVIILSLGCGDSRTSIPYEKAAKTGLFGQIMDYISQARDESTINQYLGARYLSITRKKNYTLVRINCAIPRKIDVLDGVKYIGEYERIGNELKNKIPFKLFK